MSEIAPAIEPLLLTTARVSTFDGDRPLTGGSGFFFERDNRNFLVTSGHGVLEKPSKHFPNRLWPIPLRGVTHRVINY